MYRFSAPLGYISQAMSLFLGLSVLAIAAAVTITSHPVSEIASWLTNVLGISFLSLLAVLIFTCVFCWLRIIMDKNNKTKLWVEIGTQAANGVTTLALTFTLLGISLGIGSLADQALTPSSIQKVIADMTANFSLAFMTTVIGLPVSALLRSLIVITVRYQETMPTALLKGMNT